MTTPEAAQTGDLQALWQNEVSARHRWGRHEGGASAEIARLQALWSAVEPRKDVHGVLIKQIVSLEICNWNLEESVLALARAIGREEPAEIAIGHLTSVSEARWGRVWACYAALRSWQGGETANAYRALLGRFDGEAEVQTHIADLLGVRDELKGLYVERFCLCLQFWLGGLIEQESAETTAHAAAVTAVEKAIRELDPEGEILDAMSHDGDGKLQPCHHKAFRRYDIIISSIGAGRWRAAMPMRGADGIERAEALERLLSPTEEWITGSEATGQAPSAITESLRERSEMKVFLASLLASLLRAQQLTARQLAESRISVGQERELLPG
jgi:hypothetical protein